MKTFKLFALLIGIGMSPILFGMTGLIKQAGTESRSPQDRLTDYQNIKNQLRDATADEIKALCVFLKYDYRSEGHNTRVGISLLKAALVPFVDDKIVDLEDVIKREHPAADTSDSVSLTAVTLADDGQLAESKKAIIGCMQELVKQRTGLQQVVTAVRTERASVARSFKQSQLELLTIRSQLAAKSKESVFYAQAANERGMQLKEALGFIAELTKTAESVQQD